MGAGGYGMLSGTLDGCMRLARALTFVLERSGREGLVA